MTAGREVDADSLIERLWRIENERRVYRSLAEEGVKKIMRDLDSLKVVIDGRTAIELKTPLTEPQWRQFLRCLEVFKLEATSPRDTFSLPEALSKASPVDPAFRLEMEAALAALEAPHASK